MLERGHHPLVDHAFFFSSPRRFFTINAENYARKDAAE
jgi:hypothetical protein